MGKIHHLVIAAGLAALSGAASAETLTVSGWYAAEERDVAMLHSLSVGRFDGNEGYSLASALERKLGQGRDRDGRAYYTIRSGYGKVDGVADGAMQIRVENVNFKRKVKRCPADTSSTKCPDAEKIEIELHCKRRIVSATSDVKIVRMADDAIIYSRSFPQRNQVETCEGDKEPNEIGPLVDSWVADIANQVAAQITPFGRTEKIRVRESRTGMNKEDSAQMKSLIAATKTSESAACAGWRDMEARGVKHATLSFNLGLCAESAGDLDTALSYYGALAAASRGSADVNASIERVERRMAGEADDNDRNKTGGN